MWPKTVSGIVFGLTGGFVVCRQSCRRGARSAHAADLALLRLGGSPDFERIVPRTVTERLRLWQAFMAHSRFSPRRFPFRSLTPLRRNITLVTNIDRAGARLHMFRFSNSLARFARTAYPVRRNGYKRKQDM